MVETSSEGLKMMAVETIRAARFTHFLGNFSFQRSKNSWYCCWFRIDLCVTVVVVAVVTMGLDGLGGSFSNKGLLLVGIGWFLDFWEGLNKGWCYSSGKEFSSGRFAGTTVVVMLKLDIWESIEVDLSVTVAVEVIRVVVGVMVLVASVCSSWKLSTDG
jgi:hypothetical protein